MIATKKLVAIVTIALMFTPGIVLAGPLKILITGLDNDKGQVMVALCNSEKEFKSDDAAFRSAKVRINGKSAEVVFDNLPAGQYAVKVFHDENMNGKLDKNFVGYPTESFGFSNNPVIRFGPPGYKDTVFSVKEGVVVIEIKMQ
jgi:uncharacterized protein (DUF2141 family)